MNPFRKISNLIQRWEPLTYGDTKGEPIPKWVEKAYWKWNGKFENRPYGKVKYFKGKSFIYKIECVADKQGGSYYWYRKSLIK